MRAAVQSLILPVLVVNVWLNLPGPIGVSADEERQDAPILYDIWQHDRPGQEEQEQIVQATADHAVFDIQSRTGIGQVKISPRGGKWSRQIKLRFHLRGLESVRLDNGAFTLSSGYSSTGGVPGVEVATGEESGGQRDTERIDAAHPLHFRIEPVLRGKGPPKIPLNGHFEFTVPAAFFKDSPRSITVHWIDFYRG